MFVVEFVIKTKRTIIINILYFRTFKKKFLTLLKIVHIKLDVDEESS